MKIDLSKRGLKDIDFSSHDPETASTKEALALQTVDAIDASNNEICLIRRLDVFSRLTDLNLANNRLTSPISFFVRHLPAQTLVSLDLSHNSLTSIDGGGGDGTSPARIREGGEDLLRSTFNFRMLPNLEELDLSFNNITSPTLLLQGKGGKTPSSPSSTCFFPPSLVVLKVGHNQITDIAPFVYGLVKLVTLQAEGNLIGTSQGLEGLGEGSLLSLKKLYLDGNPVVPLLGQNYRRLVIDLLAEGRKRATAVTSSSTKVLENAHDLEQLEILDGVPCHKPTAGEIVTDSDRGRNTAGFSLAGAIAEQVRQQKETHVEHEASAAIQYHRENVDTTAITPKSTNRGPHEKINNDNKHEQPLVRVKDEALPFVPRARAVVVPDVREGEGDQDEESNSEEDEATESDDQTTLTEESEEEDDYEEEGEEALSYTELHDRDRSAHPAAAAAAAAETRDDHYHHHQKSEGYSYYNDLTQQEKDEFVVTAHGAMATAAESHGKRKHRYDGRIEELKRLSAQLEQNLVDTQRSIQSLTRGNTDLERRLSEARQYVGEQLRESNALKAERGALLQNINIMKRNSMKTAHEIGYAETATEMEHQRSIARMKREQRERDLENRRPNSSKRSASAVKTPVFRQHVDPPRMTHSAVKRLETTQKRLKKIDHHEELLDAGADPRDLYDSSGLFSVAGGRPGNGGADVTWSGDTMLMEGPSPYEVEGAIPLSPEKRAKRDYRSPERVGSSLPGARKKRGSSSGAGPPSSFSKAADHHTGRHVQKQHIAGRSPQEGEEYSEGTFFHMEDNDNSTATFAEDAGNQSADFAPRPHTHAEKPTHHFSEEEDEQSYHRQPQGNLQSHRSSSNNGPLVVDEEAPATLVPSLR